MAPLDRVDVCWCEVNEMDRAVRFYRDVLGLSVRYASSHWTTMVLGDTTLGLHLGSSTERAGGYVICFQTAHADELRSRLASAGAHVEPGGHETPRGRIVEFRDPDGNRLQAIQLNSAS